MKQEFVDLGLPSGTLWGKRNVKIANKKHFTHYEIPLVEYITGYNVPSYEDFEELINLCKWEWKTIGRTKGYKVTGSNGNHIFLPAIGLYDGTSLSYSGTFGYCWSTEHIDPGYAYFLFFSSNSECISYGSRLYSLSIRLIKHKRV